MSKSEFCRLDEPSEAKYAKTLPPQLDLARLTSSLADSVTGNGSPIPACQTCGVCCSHDPVVRVGLEDSRRLGSYIEITDDEEKELVVDRVVERDFLNSRCAHLSGDIGISVQCSVYERRPDVCRHFEAGSDRCREFRRMYGLEPQLGGEEVERLSSLLQGARSGTITDAVCSVSHVKVSAQRSQTEPASFEIKRTVTVQILAAVDCDTDNWVKLHTYDPESEIWFESEFAGMTVEEALEMIESRGYQGVSN